MKEGWTYKKLGEVCEIFGRIGFRGYTKADLVDSPKDGAITLSPSNIVNGEMDYSKCSYITWAKYEESPEIMIYPGDILLVKTASVGKTALVRDLPHKATINPQFVVLKNIETNHEYLSYYMKSEKAQNFILSIAKGAAAQTVSQKNLAEMQVPVPTKAEQQRIVSRLDSAFAHIDELKANAEKQLSEARALFQKALTKAMEPKEGWEEKRLPEISENLDSMRKPVTKKDRTEGIYPYYGASGIVDYVDDYIFDENLLCISEDGANLLMRTYPIAFPISGKVWVNNHAHVLRFKCMTTQRYIEYFFAGIKLDEYITGAAQPKLTQKALNNITINIPDSIEEQQRIVSRLDSLSAHVRELEEVTQKTIAECDALKQALLRKVFE